MSEPVPDPAAAEARRPGARLRLGHAEPAEPRNAATVVLLRHGADRPEVYLLRRQTSMDFAGGMCVFPGGGVDPRDFDHTAPGPARRRPSWAARLGTDADTARALVMRRRPGDLRGVRGAARRRVRRRGGRRHHRGRLGGRPAVALEARELALTEFLDSRGLVLRTDLLGAWSAWLTPVFEPRRYRTWFFAAVLPEGQRTRDVSTESYQVTWLPVGGRSPRRSAGDADAAADVPHLPRHRRSTPTPAGARRHRRRARWRCSCRRSRRTRTALHALPARRTPTPCWQRARTALGSRMSWAGGTFGERARCVLAPNANIMTLDGTNTWVLREPGARRRWWSTPGPPDPGHLDAVARGRRRGRRRAAHPPPPRPLRGGEGVRRADGLRGARPRPGVPAG